MAFLPAHYFGEDGTGAAAGAGLEKSFSAFLTVKLSPQPAGMTTRAQAAAMRRGDDFFTESICLISTVLVRGRNRLEILFRHPEAF